MSRRLELDALRGLLLLMMAIKHLPTRISVYFDQPFGFVSNAEGFVFLSAYVAGCAYASLMREGAPLEPRHRKLRRRAWQLYGWHIGLILFAFTIAAGFALASGRPALRNMLSFYFDAPGWALLGAPVFLYQPPLLDILPMYIVFLLLTPKMLDVAARRGWSMLLGLSAIVWLFAQLGGRKLVYEGMRAITGWPLPIEAIGAFDWLAWQMLWTAGLLLGTRSSHANAASSFVNRHRSTLVTLSVATVLVFASWRYQIGGFAPDLGSMGILLDKWHLGALRLANFAALAVVVSFFVLPALAWLRVRMLGVLGRASLRAFAAHLLVCMISLGLIVNDTTPLSTTQELCVLALVLVSMWLAAMNWNTTAGGEARSNDPGTPLGTADAPPRTGPAGL